jgi:hypothetical protein
MIRPLRLGRLGTHSRRYRAPGPPPEGQIGLLVVPIARRTIERDFERITAAQAVERLLGGAVDNRSMDLERVLEDEVDRLIRPALFGGHVGYAG